MNNKDYIVKLKNIVVEYQMKSGSIRAVNEVNLSIQRGKIVALVGESGSGKTTLASTILGCLTTPGKLINGEILFHSSNGNIINVPLLKEADLAKFRWEKASMVFQAAQSSLNPVMTVWDSFYETYHHHYPKESKENILEKSRTLLDYVKLDVQRVLGAYPHELSGGMKQRVMIAFSMLLDPEFIVLDEPTTALDVITQDYIFQILKNINHKKNITMLLMTHDISVVAKFSDYVGVMYAGSIMEFGPTTKVFTNPQHPYTEGLIKATPSLWGNLSSLQPIMGTPPDLRALPSGCPFHNRCQYMIPECKNYQLKAIPYEEDSYCSCFLRMKDKVQM